MSLGKLEAEPELLGCIRSCGSDCHRRTVRNSESYIVASGVSNPALKSGTIVVGYLVNCYGL